MDIKSLPTYPEILESLEKNKSSRVKEAAEYPTTEEYRALSPTERMSEAQKILRNYLDRKQHISAAGGSVWSDEHIESVRTVYPADIEGVQIGISVGYTPRETHHRSYRKPATIDVRSYAVDSSGISGNSILVGQVEFGQDILVYLQNAKDSVIGSTRTFGSPEDERVRSVIELVDEAVCQVIESKIDKFRNLGEVAITSSKD